MFENLASFAKPGHSTNPTKNGGNSVHSKTRSENVAPLASTTRPFNHITRTTIPFAPSKPALATTGASGASTSVTSASNNKPKIFGSFNTNVGSPSWQRTGATTTTSATTTTTSTTVATATTSTFATSRTEKHSSSKVSSALEASHNDAKKKTSASTATSSTSGSSHGDRDLLLEGDDLDLEALLDDFGEDDQFSTSTHEAVSSKPNNIDSGDIGSSTVAKRRIDEHEESLLPPNLPELSDRSPKKISASSSSSSLSSRTVPAPTTTTAYPQSQRPHVERQFVSVKQETVEHRQTSTIQDKSTASPSVFSNMRSLVSSTSSVPIATSVFTRPTTGAVSRRPILEDTIVPDVRKGRVTDIMKRNTDAHQQQAEPQHSEQSRQGALSRPNSFGSNKSNKRRLPGPAGNLPKLTPEEKERLFRSRGVPLSKSELAAAAGMSTDSATGLKGSLRGVPGAQQGPVDSDFLGGAWDHLLETYGLPDYKPSTLQKYKGSSPIIAVSLSDIPNNEALYQGKIEALVVLIKECKVTELDTSVVVIDPSGEMRGTIHRKVMEHYKNNEIRVGTALALHNISIFSPTPVSHYLNITMANIAGVFTPTPTIISLSQCSSSPRTQRSLSQSSRGEGRERDTRTIKRQRSQTDSSQQSADIDPSPTRLRQLQEEEFQLSMGFAPKSPTPLHPRKRRLPRRPSPDWEDVVEEDSQERVSASNATGEGRGQGGDDDESIKEREMAAGVDYSPVVTEEALTRNNSQRRGVSKEVEEVEEGLEEEEEDEPLVRHRQSDIRRISMPKREPPIIKDEPGEAAKESQAEPIHEIQFQSLPQATGRSNDDDDKRTLTTNASQTGEDDFTFPQMGATPMGILGGPTPREQQPATPPTLAHPLPPAESKGEGSSNGDGKRTSGASSSGRALLSSFAAPKNLQRRSTFNALHSSTMPIHGPSPLSATAVPVAAKSSTSPLPATLTRDPSSNDDWLDGVDEAALNVADLEDDGDFGVTSEQQPQKEEVKEDTKKAKASSAQSGGSNIPPPTTASSSVQQLQKVVEGTEDDDFDFLLQGIDENELFDEES